VNVVVTAGSFEGGADRGCGTAPAAAGWRVGSGCVGSRPSRLVHFPGCWALALLGVGRPPGGSRPVGAARRRSRWTPETASRVLRARVGRRPAGRCAAGPAEETALRQGAIDEEILIDVARDLGLDRTPAVAETAGWRG